MDELIHITIPGSPHDPRAPVPSLPGVVIHYSESLHPEDISVHDGLRVTSPARTLIDIAEELDKDELREAFRRARELGLLDMDAMRRARARVEWRPSLATLDEVIGEFSDDSA
jgi:hypothetical protein